MSAETSRPTPYRVFPLSFLQIYQAAGPVMNALMEQDLSVRQWFGGSRALQISTVGFVIPLYYHWVTSGYGAYVDQQMVGWIFLRGWHQVLYIEALAVALAYRRRGVGRELLRFAEEQARQLRREWLGLGVTVENKPAVQLYEAEDFRRGHQRILYRDSGEHVALPNGTGQLQPLLGAGAWQAFTLYAEHDLRAGEPETGAIQSRFLSREPYRVFTGRHWLVKMDGKAVAYLHRHGPAHNPVIYLAALSEAWGAPELVGCIGRALSDTNAQSRITIKLASGAHHDAACRAFAPYGYVERPAKTMRMIKHLI